VNETTLYRVVDWAGREEIRLGAELVEGIPVSAPARLVVEKADLK
jgi:hypothetical protein